MNIKDRKNFLCKGFNTNFDHPTIFISVQNGETQRCPYCNKAYEYHGDSA